MKRNARELILEKSLALFNEQGYENVSMRQIAEECGIAVGNLTYYFHRKENVAQELMSDPLYLIADPVTDYEGLFLRLFPEMMDALERKIFFFRSPNTFLQDDEFREYYSKVEDRITGFLKDTFLSMSEEGLFRFTEEEAQMAAQMTMALHLRWNSMKNFEEKQSEELLRLQKVFLRKYVPEERLKEYDEMNGGN